METFRGNNFDPTPNIYWDTLDRSLFYRSASIAIAGFLAKKIDGSFYTDNIQEPRIPKRLLCFSNDHIFSIDTRMQREPGNARNSNIPQNHIEPNIIDVNYSISAVTRNLFSQVQCNYHSTWSRDFNYDDNILRNLSSKYYNGFLEFLNNENFERQVIHIQNEDFYEINFLSDRNLFDPECFQFICPLKLILPLNIKEFAEQGISKETKPFIFIPSQDDEEKIYIDYDRIGLSML